MKSQQVGVNVPLMVKTALVYLGLAISGWMLLRLLQACLWLPGYLRNHANDNPYSAEEQSDRMRTKEKKKHI